jgi:hypothetical protein
MRKLGSPVRTAERTKWEVLLCGRKGTQSVFNDMQQSLGISARWQCPEGGQRWYHVRGRTQRRKLM